MLIPFAVGTLLGATFLNGFSSLPPPLLVAYLFGVGVFITLIGIWLTNKHALRVLIIIVLGAIIGFTWSFIQAFHKLSWHYPLKDSNASVEVAGTVVGISQWYGTTLRFDVELTHFNHQIVTPDSGVKIRLYWLNAKQFLADGDRLRAHVKLKPPWHLSNPGSFDQEKQLFLEGIRATGKLLSLDELQSANRLTLTRLRQQLNDKMALLLEGKPLLGVIQATTLGVYKNITPLQWQTFQATGTSHAIAISGLHVSLVASVFGFIVTFAVRRSMVLTSLYPAKCYGALAAMISALLYSAIAGFSIPTLRSLIMILVVLLALLQRKKILTWHSLALGWLGIALIDPLATLQMGFWLSFCSVAALIYGATYYENGSRLKKYLAPQFVVFLGILPLNVLFFHQIAVLSPIANMLVLPIINIIVVPASLLGLLLMNISEVLGQWSLWIAHFALESVWGVLEKIAQISFSVWHQGYLPFLPMFLAFCAGVLVIAPKGFPGKNVGWLAFMPMFFYQGPQVSHGECRFTLLDVGQGLASVIQTQNHTLLYDAGPSYGDHADAGSRIIKPFLRAQHIKKLDKVIISHSDLDHRAGLNSLQDFPIGEIQSSEPLRLKMPAKQCVAGESWEWDGVQFKILGPNTLTQKKRNNLSCVLSVRTGFHKILLTGDIEQGAEDALLQHHAQALPSDILVVPHHGSLTSSSESFVQQVAPEYALYPVGLGNRYGFPKLAVIKRYEKAGSENLVVAHTGALIFHLTATEHLTPPVRWRDTSRHYWHLQPDQEE